MSVPTESERAKEKEKERERCAHPCMSNTNDERFSGIKVAKDEKKNSILLMNHRYCTIKYLIKMYQIIPEQCEGSKTIFEN